MLPATRKPYAVRRPDGTIVREFLRAKDARQYPGLARIEAAPVRFDEATKTYIALAGS